MPSPTLHLEPAQPRGLRRAEDFHAVLVALVMFHIALSATAMWIWSVGFANTPHAYISSNSIRIAGWAGLLFPLLYSPGWRSVGFYAPLATLYYLLLLTCILLNEFNDIVMLVCLFLFGNLIGLTTRPYLSADAFRKTSKHAVRVIGTDIIVAVIATASMIFTIYYCMQIVGFPPAAEHLPYLQYYFIVFGLLWCVYAWRRLFRLTFELVIECITRIAYRIRGQGPGMADFPRGPVLVIANHACWWDPLFLAGVVPRPITPMMTASFYDVWFLKPIMKHAVGVIRVPEAASRRQPPEIAEAIAALDNGECVVLFPEGYLRRKEDVPLRRFARGVYEILKARPDTPVVACWIEGGWGSWCSWKGGPPARGKCIDFRRTIDVGMSMATTVPAAVLEQHHLQARIHLMNMVNQARLHLKLEPLPEFTVVQQEQPEEAPA